MVTVDTREALKQKYREEREKRLRAEGNDQYIRINWENVKDAGIFNLFQNIAGTDDIGPYDYGSIMHYPIDCFQIDPAVPTLNLLKPVPAGVTVGQRVALSAGDIAAVALIYGAPRSPTRPAVPVPQAATTRGLVGPR